MNLLELVGMATSRPSTVELPPGRLVELPERGPVFIWEHPGPPGAPTVVLLHGLMATGGLNWFPVMQRLSRQFHVVAVDLRGHGRSMHVGAQFRLADCADDVAALADVLGVDRFIVAGYSLGGPVAQLVWYRHRSRVAGLVLCATSRNIGGTIPERTFFSLLLGGIVGLQVANRLARPLMAWGRRPAAEALADTDERLAALAATPVGAMVEAAAEALAVGEDQGAPEPDEDPLLGRWALDEMRRTNLLTMITAVGRMGSFTSHEWVTDVDVPSAVVITMQDHVISVGRQIRLAEAIEGATRHPVPAGHAACVIGARHFVPALVEACQSVAERAGFSLVAADDVVHGAANGTVVTAPSA